MRSKFAGEKACRSVISIKLQSNFIEITLWHGCSPVNLLYIFMKLFSKKTFGGLPLNWPYLINDINTQFDIEEVSLTHSFPIHPFFTVRFPDVFRGQRKGTLGTKRLIYATSTKLTLSVFTKMAFQQLAELENMAFGYIVVLPINQKVFRKNKARNIN